MNARQLEVFRAIMRNGSMTAAAEALHVSQPAVSKILRHFESQLGYTLFERLGGRLLPTMEARLRFDDADRMFREIEAVRLFVDLSTCGRSLRQAKIFAATPHMAVVRAGILPRIIVQLGR
jgi:DNA-binding transcriptional LysR family regulator